MNFYDQTIYVEQGQVGNCMQACLATVLQLPMEKVPHFALLGEEHFIPMIFLWLDYLGYETDNSPDEFAREGYPVLPYFILRGKTTRSTYHAVVGLTLTGQMVHDPHPSRQGLADVHDRLYFYKVNKEDST